MSVVTSTVAKGYFNTGDTPTESNFENLIDSIPHFGVKVYTALLTQSGTDAPVATVLENTLGGTVVWTYDSTGSYVGTLAGAFVLNKTWLVAQSLIPPSGDPISTVQISRTGVNTISVVAYNNSFVGKDDELNNTSIEIRVYP